MIRALAERNRLLAPFWLTGPDAGTNPAPLTSLAAGTGHYPAQQTASGAADTDTPLHGRRLLLIDAEDDFTAMLALQLHSLGIHITLRPYDHPDPGSDRAGHDIVILGPGPGDPQDRADRKITRLHDLARSLLDTRTPLAGVCLGHQVIASQLGLPLRRRPHPGQGRRARIELRGHSVDVGFYNSFTGLSEDAPAFRPGRNRTPAEQGRERAIAAWAIGRQRRPGGSRQAVGGPFLMTRDGMQVSFLNGASAPSR
ncbi:aminodeoxychorismate/anthranilate synthase component II [Streptomyces sp. NPDC002306]